MSRWHIILSPVAWAVSAVIPAELLDARNQITILDNLSNSKLAVLERVTEIPARRPQFIQADIRDRAALRAAFHGMAGGCDGVIHLAGLKSVGEPIGQRKSDHVRKGNHYARRLLCEFAHVASLTTSVFKSKFQSFVVRRGYRRAIIDIGHKILRTIFFMLKRRKHYRDSATDYEVLSGQRNAPRWIKALTKFGL